MAVYSVKPAMPGGANEAQTLVKGRLTVTLSSYAARELNWKLGQLLLSCPPVVAPDCEQRFVSI